jgi:hypothetical protein
MDKLETYRLVVNRVGQGEQYAIITSERSDKQDTSWHGAMPTERKLNLYRFSNQERTPDAEVQR